MKIRDAHISLISKPKLSQSLAAISAESGKMTQFGRNAAAPTPLTQDSVLSGIFRFAHGRLTRLLESLRRADPARLGFWMLFVAISVWLISSLWYVNLEFDDGYTTIINSQYFLGISGDYFWQRGPLIAALLIPAEYLANAAGLHPLDVRPHHLTIISLHLLYIWGSWSIIESRLDSRPMVLLAFTAAVPTVVYFSYAPFISHDILPGLIALYMLKLADNLHNRFDLRVWLQLATLGALVTLIKQTYIIVWIAILGASALQILCSRQRDNEYKAFATLTAAAATSAVASFLVYTILLSNSFPDVAWWARPWIQTTRFTEYFQQSGPLREIIYQWVYLRNLSAYGILAMALLLPGIILSLRSTNRFQWSTAIALCICAIFMQFVAFKEVRYLIFLGPMIAVVIVPILDFLWRHNKFYIYGCVALLFVDSYAAATEAKRIYNPYYRQQVTDFLSALPIHATAQQSIVISHRLSFISPESYAFFGDRYHRITNIIGEHIANLYNYPPDAVHSISDVRHLDPNNFQPGDILIFVNDVAARQPPLRADNKTTLQSDFSQFAATAELVNLLRSGDSYHLADGESVQPIVLLPAPNSGGNPIVSQSNFHRRDVARIIVGIPGDHVQVIGFRISVYCDISACTQY